MGTKSMWADVNTKPVQGELFWTFRHHMIMMGAPIYYNDDVERRRIHPLLLPKVETGKMTVSDEEMLKEIEVLAPTPKKKKSSSQVTKAILRGKNGKSISSRLKPRQSEGVCWPESKYGSVSEPPWKWNGGRAQLPHVYKALV